MARKRNTASVKATGVTVCNIEHNAVDGSTTVILKAARIDDLVWTGNLMQNRQPWHQSWWGICLIGIAVTIIGGGALYLFGLS